MEPIFWSDVQIDIGLTHAAGLPCDTVSKATEGVVHYTSGTDPTDGQYGFFTGLNGMPELSNRVFRISDVDGAANTFKLEGEDTTDYRTFNAGTFVIVDTLVGMDTVQDVNASGGDPEFADLTTVHNSIRRRAPTVFSPSSYTFGCFFSASDPAHQRLAKLSKNKTPEAIIFTFADGQQFAFYAYTASSGSPTGAAQEVVKQTISFEAQGLPNVYAPL